MEPIIFLILSINLVLMFLDRWQSQWLPLIIRYLIIGGTTLLFFNTLISQSKNYWLNELLEEKWITTFLIIQLVEIVLGITIKRFEQNSFISKGKEILAFVPKATSVITVLIVEIVVFDKVHGWSFKTVGLIYAVVLILIGIGVFFSLRNQKLLLQLRPITIIVFTILQLLFTFTLFNPQELHEQENNPFEIQSSLVIIGLFFIVVFIGYLISRLRNHGLRK
ncbi:hypothetical protein [Flammeovirga agarivorans]|uniref:Uncharacterized protein n=1 Tax=Flammeovirga agarivorans TaxID=2726742 RepID=A0A7X8SNB3_9BACT|nr:hypothetical protein [Flammeovirga agarivorans]NLR93342.1 hypothetical protein [Flammeovirga agarivorans]